MENLTDDIGFLAVTVRTSNGALPIENAMVSIYENRENGENGNDITNSNGYLIYSLRTNKLGQTEKVALPTKKQGNSIFYPVF